MLRLAAPERVCAFEQPRESCHCIPIQWNGPVPGRRLMLRQRFYVFVDSVPHLVFEAPLPFLTAAMRSFLDRYVEVPEPRRL